MTVAKKNKDLSNMWIRDAIRLENSNIQQLVNSYNRLKDHNTHYAKGIQRMIELRLRVNEIWVAEYNEAGGSLGQEYCIKCGSGQATKEEDK